MADSQTAEKQDSLEDSLSSEDWTIIDKKESKPNDASEEEQEDSKTVIELKETTVTNEACQSKESIKDEVDQVEECEEAGEEGAEKDVESDDVSILSDESEAELTLEVEGKIEKINWQVDNLKRQSGQLKALPSQPQLSGNSTSNTLITCSVVALIFGIIIAGQIVEFQKDHPSYPKSTEIEIKLRELNAIEDKLKELNDVKKAIDQLRLSIPDIKKSKDQLLHQSSENFKPKLSAEDYKNIEHLNLKNILSFQTLNDIHSYNNKLEMVEATYFNFCTIVNKINSTNTFSQPGLCETPKVLSELIVFKKNLKQAFEKTSKTDSSDKRFFASIERILDSISESLLSEVSVMFSKFSMKIHESLSRLENKLNKRLCLLNGKGKTDDNFINILLNNGVLRKKCKVDSNSESIVDTKYNSTSKKEKNNENKKRLKYEDFKKNGYKYDHKNVKDKKNKNFKDISREIDDENSEEISDEKSKGELKNDNWKKTKFDSKERYTQEERKSNKREKYENNYKSHDRREFEHDFDSPFERNDQDYNRNFETKRERYYDQKFGSKKEYDTDRKIEKKDYDSDYEYNRGKKRDRDNNLDQNKINYDSDDEFEYKKKNRDFDSQERRKRYSDYNKKDFVDKKSEFNKKEQVPENKYNYRSKNDRDFDDDHENKRSHNYYDEDSKFNVYLEKNDNGFLKNSEEKQKIKKDKEYIIKPENFKESKYSKYEGKDYKNDRYFPDGEWQMQRGKARENLRNSDWYFAQADLNQKSKNLEETENEERPTQRPIPPLRPSPPPQQHRKSEKEFKEPLRKRLFNKARNTLFNSKLFQFKLPFW